MASVLRHVFVGVLAISKATSVSISSVVWETLQGRHLGILSGRSLDGQMGLYSSGCILPFSALFMRRVQPKVSVWCTDFVQSSVICFWGSLSIGEGRSLQ